MYIAARPKIACTFKPIDMGPLILAFSEQGMVNRDLLATKDWMSGVVRLAQDAPIFNRIDLANTETQETILSTPWHPDKIESRGAGAEWRPTRTFIAAYPRAPQVLGGVVQGLPCVEADLGITMVNTPKDIIRDEVEKALEVGDAWVIDDLDPEIGYIMGEGCLHRTPPIELRKEDRLVVSSMLDYRRPKLGIA